MSRTLPRQTSRPGSAVVAAGAYALSGFSLWAFSEGRIPILVGLVVLPVAWDRLDWGFAGRGPGAPVRFGGGGGGLFLPLALMAAAHVLEGRRRDRGLALSLLAAGAAALLAFPVVADLAAA